MCPTLTIGTRTGASCPETGPIVDSVRGAAYSDNMRSRCKLGALVLNSVVGLSLSVGCGQQQPAVYYGLTLRVSGDHNSWDQSDQAPTLRWDNGRGRYSGVVELPGDELTLRLFAPRVGQLIGVAASPGTATSQQGLQAGLPVEPGEVTGTPIPATLPGVAGTDVKPFQLSTPLAARYQFDFDPATGGLHVDLAADAESDQPAGTALLIGALRGSDQLATADKEKRGTDFVSAMKAGSFETPLRSSASAYQSLTIVHLGTIDGQDLSVVGDFNGWTAGHDPMHFALGGRVAYIGRRAQGVRLEYRFDRDGERYSDPLNLEVAWNGVTPPPNPNNLLGGNQGDFNSVAFASGYVEQGPRLRRLAVPGGPLGTGEVYIYLPPGYDPQSGQTYPTIYIHDGKDAIVRGQYDRSLYLLGARKLIPKLVGVFVSAPSDPATRLAAFASFPDPKYPEVMPQGADFGRYLLETVLPAVEASYRAGAPRAMVGIDMAGPFTFNLAWTDDQHRFVRLGSQSGRFGWGDLDPAKAPYLKVLAKDQSPVMQRLSFDWSDGDHFQAQLHDAMRPYFALAGYSGKVAWNNQPDSTTDCWANLRARAEVSLTFLLKDLVPPTKP